MLYSVTGWTRGVPVKLWDPLKTRAIPERLRGVFTTRRYTNPSLPLQTLQHCNIWSSELHLRFIYFKSKTFYRFQTRLYFVITVFKIRCSLNLVFFLALGLFIFRFTFSSLSHGGSARAHVYRKTRNVREETTILSFLVAVIQNSKVVDDNFRCSWNGYRNIRIG